MTERTDTPPGNSEEMWAPLDDDASAKEQEKKAKFKKEEQKKGSKKPEQKKEETSVGDKTEELEKIKEAASVGGRMRFLEQEIDKTRQELTEKDLAGEDITTLSEKLKSDSQEYFSLESALGRISQRTGESGMERMIEAMSAQQEMAQLGFPTPELVSREIGKKVEIGSVEYGESVRSWFENILQRLEMSDQSYEIQASLWQILNSSVVRLGLHDETKILSSELGTLLNARMKAKTMVVIHRRGLPDQIHQANSMTTEDYKILFTLRTINPKTGQEEAAIAETFREYEEIATPLKELDEQKEDVQAKNIRSKLVEMFHHGGSVDGVDEMARDLINNFEQLLLKTEDVATRDKIYKAMGELHTDPSKYLKDRLTGLKKVLETETDKVKRSKLQVDIAKVESAFETKERDARLQEMKIALSAERDPRERKILEQQIKEEEYDIWRYKMAGGLWSLTLRSAYFDNPDFNGLGDFMYSRLLNPVKKLSDAPLYQHTREFWKNMDFGVTDMMTTFMGGISWKMPMPPDTRDRSRPEWSEYRRKVQERIDREDEFRVKTGISYKLDHKMGETPADDKEKIGQITSMANARLEDEAFWDVVSQEAHTKRDQPSTHTFYLGLADASRKVIFAKGAFANNPNMENFTKLTEAFENISQGKEYVVLNGKRKVVSGWQQKQYELLNDFIKWMKTPEGKVVVSGGGAFTDADIFNAINMSLSKGAISQEQRAELYRQYLNTPFLPFLSIENKAIVRKAVSLVLSPITYGPARLGLVFGSVMETFKSLLGYIFSSK